MESIDEFLIVERSYSDDESKLSGGLANIHAEVPDVEATCPSSATSVGPQQLVERDR
ncbi:MAG: hypothetical protein QOI48_2490 [Solirubrobacteraceae bacterium]|nr:hypothetical protein [Solirubrobacteraceae bacterium]